MEQRFQATAHMDVLQHSQSIYFNTHQRYRLLEPLGQGGMGMVYRAHDRLTGQAVALKQITVAPQELHFSSRPASDDQHQLLLSLAQEFKLLASLRHPNIISVFDYGFDAERRPYFTMELLEEVQTLREAGRRQPLQVQIDLLVQTLQALAYLHRRGILHHDLKPENVMVSAGRVRVLDFGLSVLHDQLRSNDSSGSLLYLPPEIFTGVPYTVVADLYAVGVMAYELFTGQHPFYASDLDLFYERLLHAEPQLDLLPPTVVPVLAKLLNKQPRERYTTAEQVITALAAATGQPPPVESWAVRESFLQAATFVGRTSELTAFNAALGAAQRGKGSAWLIGGESGVGKSRLLDEVRTHALVAGAIVLRGQAVEGGGLPYQLWREPLRRLAIASTLSELEAGVLKEVVPDLEKLLECPLAEAPKLTGEAGQERLGLTLVELLKRLSGPVVLLLEDLHWSSESLVFLQLLNRFVAEQPWLLIGTYRDDERPQLPAELPEMQRIKLARLSEQEVTQLSGAMLGEVGQQPALVNLLQRQSEGNTFFMVEVIRVLAEEAGDLAAIGRMTLPMRVVAGGMQAVLRRRLQQIPVWAQPLLKLAALSGRQLDRTLLQALAPSLDLARWLQVGVDAAVFEIHDEQWRFAHDKLREELIAQLEPDERQRSYHQLAEALETVYAGDLNRAEILLEYWRAAGEPAKELDYLLVVTRQRLESGMDAQSMQQLLLRGLELSPAVPQATSQQVMLRKRLGDTLFRSGAYAAAQLHYEDSLHLAEAINDTPGRSSALHGLGMIAWRQGNLAQAEQQLNASLALARQAEDRDRLGVTLKMLGVLSSEQANYQTAAAYYQQSKAIGEALGDAAAVTLCLINLGNDAQIQGDFATAHTYLAQALSMAHTINASRYIAHALSILALVAQKEGNLPLAIDYISQGLAIDREIDDRYALAYDLISCGNIQLELQALAEARQSLRQGLEVAQKLGGLPNILLGLLGFANLALYAGQLEWAGQLCGFVEAHPALTPEMRQYDLAPLLTRLAVVLPPDALAVAQASGRTMDLNAISAAALEQAG